MKWSSDMSFKKLLIGSKALKYHFSDFPREPKDTDYICEEKIDKTDSKFCSSYKLILDKYSDLKICPSNILYTLKVSHSFWDIHWDKTMSDIRFLQSKGFRKVDEILFKELYKDCEIRYGSKKAYLNKSNEDFFKDVVKRKYVHDDLHKAMAFYDVPLYEKLKKDSSKAMVSYKLFSNLSYEDKIKLCQEEIYVTALERFLIPSDFKIPPFSAYLRACKLLIISMTKGWFPKFIVENWIDISTNNKYDFIRKFKNNIEQGKIKEI